MKNIIGSRGMGKTTQMLKAINGKGIYIICHDQNDVDNLWRTIKGSGFNVPMPVTINEKIAGGNTVFIENIDLALNSIKDDWIVEAVGLDFKINIENTLKFRYLQKGLKVYGYTQNIPDEYGT